MDFLTLAKKRYSVRAYTKQKVEKEKLDAILEAAHVAPTGGNCQPQHLIVVQSDEGLRKIGKATNIYGAPLAIIVCSDTNKVWTRPFDGKKLTDIDASIITDHMMMEATYRVGCVDCDGILHSSKNTVTTVTNRHAPEFSNVNLTTLPSWVRLLSYRIP